MKFLQQLLKTNHFPKPADPAQSQHYLTEWQEKAAKTKDSTLSAFMQAVAKTPLLSSVFGNSAYLAQSLLRQPAFLKIICDSGFDTAFTHIFNDCPAYEDREAISIFLRKAKLQCALLVALADISEYWPLAEVTKHLTLFADRAISVALNCLLTRAAIAGQLKLRDKENPGNNSGLIVLGVGKLGSFELNYSSDIDLIFFFDEEKVQYTGKTSITHFFVRLVQEFTQLMQERTAHGYVFRTDLRLRPDPAQRHLRCR